MLDCVSEIHKSYLYPSSLFALADYSTKANKTRARGDLAGDNQCIRTPKVFH